MAVRKAKRTTPRFRRSLAAVLSLTTVAVTVTVFVPDPAFADEVRGQQWYLDALKIDKVHELSQGEGVTIGVIDSGIDAEHPDLKGNIEAGKAYGNTKKDGLKDASGHGTSVASLIVGHGHGKNSADGILGIAPKAKVISVSVDETVQANYDAAEAMKWLVDEKKVDIISVSLGGGATNFDGVSYADQHGVQVVAAAGNTEPDPYFGAPGEMGWPAYNPGAMPVSGTDQYGNFWEGSVDLSSADPQPQLGVSAPATDLVTAKKGGGYETHSGTSGSAPLVAGSLALIKSAYPDLSYESYTERLLGSVDDKGPKGFDDKYGWGIINPYRALTEESVFIDADGKEIVSDPNDIVPLEEQGKEREKNKKEDAASNDELTASTSFAVPAALIATGAVLALGIVVLIVVAIRRNRSQVTMHTNDAGTHSCN